MAATTASVLARDLRARIRGQVRIDAGARALYATDASNYRQLPIAVITPRDEADVVAAVAVCRDHQLPVLARGGGTSLAGQGCNTAVVLDFSRHMNNILELNPDARTATVQPGVVLDDLRDAAARRGLTFGPDPATHSRCTLGGMIGNNSCGVHSIMAGRTAGNVLELDILTYDGHRMRVGPTSPEQLDQIIAAGGRRAGIYAGLAALRDRCGDQVRERCPVRVPLHPQDTRGRRPLRDHRASGGAGRGDVPPLRRRRRLHRRPGPLAHQRKNPHSHGQVPVGPQRGMGDAA